MPKPNAFPEDPRLAEIAREIEKTGWAAILCDAEWKLVWASSEIKALIGEEDETKLGYGRPIFEAYMSEPWFNSVTESTRLRLLEEAMPRMIGGTPGGIDAIPLNSELAGLCASIVPVKSPPLWSSRIEFVQPDMPVADVNEVNVRLMDWGGEFLGTVIIYGSALPASLLTLVSRGDRGAFERMARLYQPGRRAAAILFADMQFSVPLSRRLPSAAYFELVRSLTTRIDEIIVNQEGIVGKHAGDGVTAFFLANDLGSPSAAARAAVESARAIPEATRKVTEEAGDDLLSADDCLVNVGVHWSDTLYMGQLVTGGRLEVTALGDAVNECARIQESARNGNALGSKTLVEQLVGDDARALGFDPDRVLYTALSDLPDVTEKGARDAGGIPVTPL